MKKLITAIILIALLTACDDQSVKRKQFTIDEASIIATVESEPITLEQVQNEMRYRGGHIPGRFASLESREDLLDEIIHFEVLAQKAKAAGYGNDPEIKVALKKMMVKKFQQDYLEKLLHKQRVTNLDVQNYYQEHQEEFSTPDMVRAAIISIRFNSNDDQSTIARKQKKANLARKKALKQQTTVKDFGQLAREYSDDVNTRYRGGAMTWMAKFSKTYRWDKKVVNAIFSLKKKGEISPLVETPRGFFLVKLMDTQKGQLQPYKVVQNQIKQKLVAEKKRKWLEEYYKDAKTDYEISINTDRLEKIPTPGRFAKSNATPPGFPVD
ncbi:MAG: peptidylprolyl isomerase [Proteobacteria bacterium]|nr:peptidylprolyl isomerase [Pseudomonadota bacterium]